MILLVTLLYFIKSNEDYVDDDNVNLNLGEDNHEEYQNLNSSIPITNTYVAPNNINTNDLYDDEDGDLLDLETITKKLENKELAPIDLTSFEEEQEKEAIISYDELLKKSNQDTYTPSKIDYEIPYKSEIMLDDLLVKEVDLDNLNKTNKEVKNEEVVSINYGDEQAFLDALKELREQLH